MAQADAEDRVLAAQRPHQLDDRRRRPPGRRGRWRGTRRPASCATIASRRACRRAPRSHCSRRAFRERTMLSLMPQSTATTLKRVVGGAGIPALFAADPAAPRRAAVAWRRRSPGASSRGRVRVSRSAPCGCRGRGCERVSLRVSTPEMRGDVVFLQNLRPASWCSGSCEGWSLYSRTIRPPMVGVLRFKVVVGDAVVADERIGHHHRPGRCRTGRRRSPDSPTMEVLNTISHTRCARRAEAVAVVLLAGLRRSSFLSNCSTMRSFLPQSSICIFRDPLSGEGRRAPHGEEVSGLDRHRIRSGRRPSVVLRSPEDRCRSGGRGCRAAARCSFSSRSTPVLHQMRVQHRERRLQPDHAHQAALQPARISPRRSAARDRWQSCRSCRPAGPRSARRGRRRTRIGGFILNQPSSCRPCPSATR